MDTRGSMDDCTRTAMTTRLLVSVVVSFSYGITGLDV